MARRGGNRTGTTAAALGAAMIIAGSGCATAEPEPAAPPPTTALPTTAPPTTAPPTTAVEAAPVELPGGGRTLFPGRVMVALYGHPGAPALGVLGEQDVAGALARAKDLAAQYQALTPEPVLPTFELIATVASASAGPDGDYSNESTVEELRPWVDAAGAAGGYVLLDLQPGRADFLTQAQRYTDLLAQPHVGLALDAEWRLRPDQRHNVQVGSVDVAEVNQVTGWLADLTRDRGLPPKVLMLHQFRLEMIRGREQLDTTRPEVTVVLHADGFGVPDDKMKTWARLHEGAPAGVFWGWKNFIDEDTPMATPQQTLQIGPTTPVIVTYQ